MVGTGLLITVPAAPAVQLTTVECSIGDVLCAGDRGLIGAAASGSTPSAAATLSANAAGDFVSIFIGNGTAENPNAGLLIGDGYTFTADDVGGPNCTAGSPCNGGNAGLLFGNGGGGYDGGKGGNAYLYGGGGNGGNAVDFGLVGEDNFGGDGGVGGFLGGTDPLGNFFTEGGGNGGNGINGGNGGNGGSAGFFGIAVAGNAGKGGNGGAGTSTNPNGGNGGNGGQEARFPLLYGGDTSHNGGNGGDGYGLGAVGGNGGNGGNGGDGGLWGSVPGGPGGTNRPFNRWGAKRLGWKVSVASRGRREPQNRRDYVRF